MNPYSDMDIWELLPLIWVNEASVETGYTNFFGRKLPEVKKSYKSIIISILFTIQYAIHYNTIHTI
jgi:hypothetical protein